MRTRICEDHSKDNPTFADKVYRGHYARVSDKTITSWYRIVNVNVIMNKSVERIVRCQ